MPSLGIGAVRAAAARAAADVAADGDLAVDSSRVPRPPARLVAARAAAEMAHVGAGGKQRVSRASDTGNGDFSRGFRGLSQLFEFAAAPSHTRSARGYASAGARGDEAQGADELRLLDAMVDLAIDMLREHGGEGCDSSHTNGIAK